MAVGDVGSVTHAQRTYRVTTILDTLRKTHYFVQCPSDPAHPRSRVWKAAEVTVGAESVFVCLVCKRHPSRPCIHVEVVQKYVAGLPLEPVA